MACVNTLHWDHPGIPSALSWSPPHPHARCLAEVEVCGGRGAGAASGPLFPAGAHQREISSVLLFLTPPQGLESF